MNITSKAADGRNRFLVVPFKAYMVGVPAVVALCRIVSLVTGQDMPDGLRFGAAAKIAREDHQLFTSLVVGYAVCAFALLLLGAIVLKDQKSRRSTLIWAVAGMAVVGLYLLGSKPAVMR